MTYVPVPHPELESTGITRPPEDGEWFRCTHPDCQEPDRVHRAGESSFPYPAREILREVR